MGDSLTVMRVETSELHKYDIVLIPVVAPSAEFSFLDVDDPIYHAYLQTQYTPNFLFIFDDATRLWVNQSQEIVDERFATCGIHARVGFIREYLETVATTYEGRLSRPHAMFTVDGYHQYLQSTGINDDEHRLVPDVHYTTLATLTHGLRASLSMVVEGRKYIRFDAHSYLQYVDILTTLVKETNISSDILARRPHKISILALGHGEHQESMGHNYARQEQSELEQRQIVLLHCDSDTALICFSFFNCDYVHFKLESVVPLKYAVVSSVSVSLSVYYGEKLVDCKPLTQLLMLLQDNECTFIGDLSLCPFIQRDNDNTLLAISASFLEYVLYRFQGSVEQEWRVQMASVRQQLVNSARNATVVDRLNATIEVKESDFNVYQTMFREWYGEEPVDVFTRETRPLSLPPPFMLATE